VNMGEVCYMRQLPNHTALYFDTQVVTVRESISEIRAAAEQTRGAFHAQSLIREPGAALWF
jgi:hypothetical protein